MTLFAVDANVLVYSVDLQAEPGKRNLAKKIILWLGSDDRAVFPMQALAEFYSVATRKGLVDPVSAAAQVMKWGTIFPVHSADLVDIAEAMRVHRDHGIPFWDGMVWAVARRAGAGILLSEDFQDGRELEGVRFMNPFAPANQDRLAAALAG